MVSSSVNSSDIYMSLSAIVLLSLSTEVANSLFLFS